MSKLFSFMIQQYFEDRVNLSIIRIGSGQVGDQGQDRVRVRMGLGLGSVLC